MFKVKINIKINIKIINNLYIFQNGSRAHAQSPLPDLATTH